MDQKCPPSSLEGSSPKSVVGTELLHPPPVSLVLMVPSPGHCESLQRKQRRHGSYHGLRPRLSLLLHPSRSETGVPRDGAPPLSVHFSVTVTPLLPYRFPDCPPFPTPTGRVRLTGSFRECGLPFHFSQNSL